jgi:SAM-dependent methyltransferase
VNPLGNLYDGPPMKRHAPATERNRGPILEVLRPLLREGALVLEVASGTGQHAAFFAAAMSDIVWQPSDVDPANLASIEAWRAEAAAANLRAPLQLDATADAWPVDRADALFCANMIHIAPWAACEGLMRGAARLLGEGALLFLYGPFLLGARTAPSNLKFDASLRSQDPAWGVRDLDEVTALAAASGLRREAVIAMPANNCSVVFRRT